MPAADLYYIRHGETDWNAIGRLQGTQDIPLNDLGRKQAAHVGGVLAGLFARDGRDRLSLPFVASPLGRARATMELVRGTLNLPPHDYAIDDRLREIAYGAVGRFDAGGGAGARPRTLRPAPGRQMERRGARRRELRRGAGEGERLVRQASSSTPSRWRMAAPRGR